MKFATGLEATSNDLGAMFEETLLVYALLAAGLPIGIPHFCFSQPITTNEIDFAIYDTHGHGPGEAWQATIADQSLCAWEVTCGHLAEPGRHDEPDDKGREPQHLPGADHPQKKLVNFLALKTFGFYQLHFHYLSVLPPQNVSQATARALENTAGFSYWCLGSEVPDLEARVLTSESGIDVALLRSWHQKIVGRVEQQARSFAEVRKMAPAASAKLP
ncbi:MAG TPA: hypothetical protein VH165_31380, partial [Kofleriaceae bacterium]|nr:hypothetical protein [Kofleriaceae bacterium]